MPTITSCSHNDASMKCFLLMSLQWTDSDNVLFWRLSSKIISRFQTQVHLASRQLLAHSTVYDSSALTLSSPIGKLDWKHFFCKKMTSLTFRRQLFHPSEKNVTLKIILSSFPIRFFIPRSLSLSLSLSLSNPEASTHTHKHTRSNTPKCTNSHAHTLSLSL